MGESARGPLEPDKSCDWCDGKIIVTFMLRWAEDSSSKSNRVCGNCFVDLLQQTLGNAHLVGYRAKAQPGEVSDE